MPFAHERRRDETTITDFGAAPVHDRGDKAATAKSAVFIVHLYAINARWRFRIADGDLKSEEKAK